MDPSPERGDVAAGDISERTPEPFQVDLTQQIETVKADLRRLVVAVAVVATLFQTGLILILFWIGNH